MIFAIEPLPDVWDEMIRLATKHWNETQAYRHNRPFAPSFERYNQYASQGWFLQFTAREDGKLVGYGGVYIVPCMHTQALIATEDTWYLSPDHRKGWAAVKFFKFMEDECRARGATRVNLSTPNEAVGVICDRLGYERVAICYSKSLDAPERTDYGTNQLARADSALRQPEVELSNVSISGAA